MEAMQIERLASPYSPDPKIASLGDKIGDTVRAADFPQTTLRFRNDRTEQQARRVLRVSILYLPAASRSYRNTPSIQS